MRIFTGILIFGLAQISYPQGGVTTSPAGIVRIDSWTCYTSVPLPGTMSVKPAESKPCPERIEIAEDVPDSVLICRSTKTGQTCRTIRMIFGPPSK